MASTSHLNINSPNFTFIPHIMKPEGTDHPQRPPELTLNLAFTSPSREIFPIITISDKIRYAQSVNNPQWLYISGVLSSRTTCGPWFGA
jgi:hypothetical protein